MTNDLKPGDKVVMNEKYFEGGVYVGRVWTVLSYPWKVGGTEVVTPKGRKGGYAVDGLQKVEG